MSKHLLKNKPQNADKLKKKIVRLRKDIERYKLNVSLSKAQEFSKENIR